MQEEKMFWTVYEVAVYLGVKPSTVYSWVKAGEIPYYRIGKMLKFKRGDVDLWMENHRREGISVDKKTRGILRAINKPRMDVDSLVKKSIDEVKKGLYPSTCGRPDQVRGLGKEVSNGTL